MILRFKTTAADGSCHYLALNTETRGYTQGIEAAGGIEPQEISPAAYSYILNEMNFNLWGYTHDIMVAPEEEDDTPLF